MSRIERGRLAGLSTRAIEKALAVLDAELVVFVRWRGGDLDRLLDRDHAAMNEVVASRLAGHGWLVEPEVSYSEFGERGSIDLLAWHPPSRTILVIEVKTELVSVEETLRRHDAKARLGADIARKRFGWSAAVVARLLVLPDSTTARERVRGHSALFDRVYGLRGVELRHWLEDPASARAGGGLWFLRPNDHPRHKRRLAAVKRVRRSPSRDGRGSRAAEIGQNASAGQASSRVSSIDDL